MRHPVSEAKRTAYAAMNKAIRDGLLPPARVLRCVTCGGQAAHYHHDQGYRKADRLQVIPVCTTCHGKHHRSPAKPKAIPTPRILPTKTPVGMTLKEAEARYGVQRRTLNNAIVNGDLAAERAGPLWLVRAAAVERWLERGRRPLGRPVVNKRLRKPKQEG